MCKGWKNVLQSFIPTKKVVVDREECERIKQEKKVFYSTLRNTHSLKGYTHVYQKLGGEMLKEGIFVCLNGISLWSLQTNLGFFWRKNQQA